VDDVADTAGRFRVRAEEVGALADGTVVHRWTLAGDRMTVRVLTYGGIVQSIEVPDRDGRQANVALGFATLDAYVRDNRPYFGAVIGRYANRIAGGDDAAGVELAYTSPDGEMGYPGRLAVRVRYTLGPGDELRIDYRATTDAPRSSTSPTTAPSTWPARSPRWPAPPSTSPCPTRSASGSTPTTSSSASASATTTTWSWRSRPASRGSSSTRATTWTGPWSAPAAAGP
jgi:hypothetical protein